MRIAVNALPSRVGGGLTFLTNLLPALDALDPENEYVVIVTASQTALRSAIPSRFEQKVLKLPTSYVIRTMWEQLVLPWLLLLWRIDILFTTANMTTLLAPCAKVVEMTGSNHFSPLHLRRVYGGPFKQAVIRAFAVVSAFVAQRMIFLSEDSRSLMLPRLHTDVARTRVIPYGWRPVPPAPLAPALAAKIGSEYILTVSVLFAHKNLERLMEAFDLLCEGGAFDGNLVIAGAIVDPGYYGDLDALRSRLRHGGRIVFTDEVTQAQVATLYGGARLFVFPSIEETFGVPLLEAMGYGVPQCASDCSLGGDLRKCFNPFRELAGDAALYFDPFDPRSIRDATARLLGDASLCSELAMRGRERVQRFTWERTAKETIDVFREVKR